MSKGMSKGFMAGALLLSTVLVAGCTTSLSPDVEGGSRSNGTITLSYTYNPLEKPDINWAEANEKAATFCKNWGYESAERYRKDKPKCKTGKDCRIFVHYQCTSHRQAPPDHGPF